MLECSKIVAKPLIVGNALLQAYSHSLIFNDDYLIMEKKLFLDIFTPKTISGNIAEIFFYGSSLYYKLFYFFQNCSHFTLQAFNVRHTIAKQTLMIGRREHFNNDDKKQIFEHMQ